MKDDPAKEDFEEADDLGDIDAIDDRLDNEATTPPRRAVKPQTLTLFWIFPLLLQLNWAAVKC